MALQLPKLLAARVLVATCYESFDFVPFLTRMLTLSIFIRIPIQRGLRNTLACGRAASTNHCHSKFLAASRVEFCFVNARPRFRQTCDEIFVTAWLFGTRR